MNPARRQVFMIGLLATCLLTLLGWSFFDLADERSAATSAAERLMDCQRLAESIRSLRSRPTIAGSRELQIEELTRYIEQAAQAMQIQSLARISPESPQRLGDSPYLEKPTQLLLRGVTLGQLSGFLHHLSTNGSGLRVRNLRLSAPREEETSDRWTVEATITYLLYSPVSSGGTARAGGGA